MRLFVALDLPATLRERLRFLSGGLPGARWLPPENLHATLRFIGEVQAWRADEIDAALARLRAPSFPLDLAGVGIIERNGRPATLYAGIERSPPLDHLQAKIETALQRAGLPPARRRFLPHITLARIESCHEERLAAWIQANNLFRAASVQVDHFTLFSSLLGKQASAYTPEVEYSLAPP